MRSGFGVAAIGLLCLAVSSCAPSRITTVAPMKHSTGVSPSPIIEMPPRLAESGEGPAKPYRVASGTENPATDMRYDQIGLASWYGAAFHGKRTANGELFDKDHLTAAHPSLPLPSYVRLTNLENERSIIVRVNDRGPYSHSRLIDVSERVAEVLDFKRGGMAQLRVQYVDAAPLKTDDASFLMASYQGPENGAPKGVLASLKTRFSLPASISPTPPIVVAAAQSRRKALAASPSADVSAFADVAVPAGEGTSAGDAVTALTSSYDPDERIFMAFDSAETAGE